MSRIDREWHTVEVMIDLYCRRFHGAEGVCSRCSMLKDYVRGRMEHCPQGKNKRSCRVCQTHCYSPACREQIRAVMCYSGRRMLLIHPIMTLRHLWYEVKPKLL